MCTDLPGGVAPPRGPPQTHRAPSHRRRDPSRHRRDPSRRRRHRRDPHPTGLPAARRFGEGWAVLGAAEPAEEPELAVALAPEREPAPERERAPEQLRGPAL